MAETQAANTTDGAQPHRFGEMAVALSYVTPEQLALALKRQDELRAGGARSRLGETMVIMKLLDEEKVRKVLGEQRKRRLYEANQKLPVEQFGEYKLVRRIGEGGMGTVYEARDVLKGSSVALKVLRKGLGVDKSYVHRFSREISAAERLEHPNIVITLNCGTMKGIQYLAMEYVDGETFKTTIELDKQVEEKKALRIVLDVARALQHAHKLGLVHRDVKPENVLITKEGVAKLADLGLSKSVYGDSQLTQTGEIVGSPNYISPEQAKGQREPDPRSDWYSLGATFYHALTGKQPFAAASPLDAMMLHIKGKLANPKELNPKLSDAAVQIVVKMMAKEAGERYQSAAEVIEDLEAALKGDAPKNATLAAGRSTVENGAGTASAQASGTELPKGKGCLGVLALSLGLAAAWMLN